MIKRRHAHRITLKEGGRLPLRGSEHSDAEGTARMRQWILRLAS